MPSTFTVLLITGSLLPSAPEVRFVDAVDIFRNGFEEAADVNFDLWPDGWKRQRDDQHPAYLKIHITDKEAYADQRSLELELNAGAATVFSPRIDVSPNFSYELGGHVKTQGLENDVAFCTISYYDGDDQLLHTHRSSDHTNNDWQPIQIAPFTPAHPAVQYAIIGMHLRPLSGLRPDLVGQAWFDDISLGRLPRMSLHMNHRSHIYALGEEIELTCKVSGVFDRDPVIEFELFDAAGKKIADTRRSFDGRGVSAESPSVAPKTETGPPSSPMGRAGTPKWRLPISDYGYYRVRVAMTGTRGLIHQRDASVVVLRSFGKTAASGEFGWTIPDGDERLSMEDLTDLLPRAGVSWLKFPVWFSEYDNDRADQIARFAERLSILGIEMVGMVDQPPHDVRDLFGETDNLQVAQIFADPDLWKRHLNPVLTRLSLKLSWWQLGRDDDISFMGYPDLVMKIDEIRQQIERFGRETHLGISWRWIFEPPRVDSPPWKFLTYSAEPPLTPQELDAHLTVRLEDKKKNESGEKWVVIRTLPQSRYQLATRTRDLVQTMLTAKLRGADAAFIPNPFDREHGLLRSDGTPSDLLVPWSTTALLLSGTEYLGSFEMPNGSPNHVFRRDREAIVVTWNDERTEERMFFGKNVEMVDLWGRTIPIENDDQRQIVQVGPEPVFLTGVHLPIALWRIGFSLDRGQLASVFGRPQRAGYELVNGFSQGVSGTMTMHLPEGWDSDARTHRFKIAEGREFSNAFNVTLRPAARSGNHKIRADFELTAERIYEFSVYRHVELGLGNVGVEVTTKIDQQGNLVVTQILTNQGENPVSFDCLLFAPDRRRQRRHVLNLVRGRNSQIYLLPRGEELLGKTIWMRAEEIGGERMLNHQIIVER